MFGSSNYGKKVYEPKELSKYNFYDYMEQKHNAHKYGDETESAPLQDMRSALN